jgi:hypothetical protein
MPMFKCQHFMCFANLLNLHAMPEVDVFFSNNLKLLLNVQFGDIIGNSLRHNILLTFPCIDVFRLHTVQKFLDKR